MTDSWNNWSGYRGDDMAPPDLRRKQRTAVDRDVEYAVLARDLAREWRRGGGVLTPRLVAGLDALASK